MIINVSTIAHEKQRYETVGDWIVDNGNLPSFTVFISEMNNPDYAFLVSIHEQIEMYLCWKRGITQESVDEFDKTYENNRKDGDLSEPGDDPLAPYFREHQFATKLEKLMSEELGVSWDDYDNTVCSL